MNAQDKNATALSAVVDSALKVRLESSRIGIWSDTNQEAKASGLILAEALGELLGRLWRNLDAYGPYSDIVLKTASAAAASGMQPLSVSKQWAPPYDFVIAIGSDAPDNAGLFLRVGAIGWKAMLGTKAVVGDDMNPVGPAAAAAITAIEVFKKIFADALGDKAKQVPTDFEWSAWDYGKGGAAPATAPLHFASLHIFGVGAVTHGFLWLLERWPATVTGTIDLVDQDNYDVSNGQRYVGMREGNAECPKTRQAAERLRERHKGIEINDHAVDMNTYFESKLPSCNIPLAIIGVDSPEHRRQLALKLPKRVINMWTEGDWLGAARFGFEAGWPCLFCAYPENAAASLDETGQLSQETGLLPARVRELLFSGGGLNQADVSALAQKYGSQNVQGMLNKPLRNVRGALCATGKITLPGGAKDESVPFAFSSMFAGIAGFIELLHEIYKYQANPGHWQLRVYAYPVEGNWTSRGAKPDCYVCSDDLVHKIFLEKYTTTNPGD